MSVNDGLEVLYIDTPSIIVNALSGDDVITVRTPAPNDAVWDVDVTINGGPPTASDKVVVETLYVGDETVAYTPTGINSGLLDISSLSSPITLTDVEELIYNGSSIDDSDSLDRHHRQRRHRPRRQPGRRRRHPVDVNGNALLSLTYLHVLSVTVTGTTAVIQGTSANDTITVDAVTGVVTVTNLLGFSNTVDLSDNVAGTGFTRVVATPWAATTPSPCSAAHCSANGVSRHRRRQWRRQRQPEPRRHDRRRHHRHRPAHQLGHRRRRRPGQPRRRRAPERHRQLAAAGDAISVTSLGSVTGLQSITHCRQRPGGDAVSVTGTSGPDILNFNPTDATSGQVTRTGTVTTVNYAGLAGTMTIGGGTGGFDVLTVLGTENADTVTSTATTVTRDGTVTLGTGIDRLDVTGLGGNDSIATSVLLLHHRGRRRRQRSAPRHRHLARFILRGGGGDDALFGGTRADRLEGGDGNDMMVGGPGDDFASAGPAPTPSSGTRATATICSKGTTGTTRWPSPAPTAPTPTPSPATTAASSSSASRATSASTWAAWRTSSPTAKRSS